MVAILELEKFQSKTISVIYRLTLIAYAIFLLWHKSIEFSVWVNIGALAIYFALFILFFKHGFYQSIFRLVNDYLLIFFILYQVGFNDLISLSFLFLPILNSQNHSGPKKTWLLYLLPLLGLYLLFPGQFTHLYFVPFLFFFIINKWSGFRIRYFRFQQKLNTLIDDFFTKNANFRKTYLIYKGLIDLLNETGILNNSVSAIICVHLENEKISLVNSSKFIWNISFEKEKEFYKKAREAQSLRNYIIKLDNEETKYNLIINSHFENQTYSYILQSNGPYVYIDSIKTVLIIRLLTPFFKRYSKILIGNYEHKKNEIGQLASLQEKITYVSNSVNSMHFIRNKLGPIKNYLAMSQDYEKSGKEKRKVIGPFLKNERRKLDTSISEILERADYILKKSNNPFNVYELEEFGIQQLYSETRMLWNYYFDVQNFKIEWNIDKQYIKKYVKYNSVGLDFVLNNWISNMYKNNAGFFQLVFTEDELHYILKFINSVEPKEENFKFIKDYNESNRDEIARRKSHGLYEIKDFIGQMDLISTLTREGNNVVFILKLKKYITDEHIDYRK